MSVWFEWYLIDTDDWRKRRNEMPDECKKVVDSDPWFLYGGSTGIGHCEKLGWFIVRNFFGQPPSIAWSEKEYVEK